MGSMEGGTTGRKINVALVGLGFGNAFAGIYKAHPDVAQIGLYDTDARVLAESARWHGIEKTYGSFEEVLRDGAVDAVHLVSPIPLHEEQAVAVLDAGKHCACTVPMATTREGLRRIIAAKRRSGKNYMMMETTLYTYQYLYAKEMLERGEFGGVQFLIGTHYQDMAAWPDYWMGLPPMHYGTHAIAPVACLAGSRICRASCRGSGAMDPALAARYGNPYPVESALFEFENGLTASVTRSLFETARQYEEGFYVYGRSASFEWNVRDEARPFVTTLAPPEQGSRGGGARVEQRLMPNYHARLPEPLQRFTVGDKFDPLNPQKSLMEGSGGGHHGSHPHLVHEFVRSVVEGRAPAIDETLAANITGAGIVAHESAMQGGAPLDVPEEW